MYLRSQLALCSLALSISFSLALPAQADPMSLPDLITATQATAYDTAVPDNAAIFNQYCIGDSTSASIPEPNYSNDLVKFAAAKLSETKLTADQKLQKNALEALKQNIEYAKTATAKLITDGSATIKALATDLMTELNLPITTGLSAKAQSLYNDIVKAYATDLKANADRLNIALPSQLKTVDMAKLKTIADGLNKALPKQLVAVDMVQLKDVSLKLTATVDKLVASKTADPAVLIDAMTVLKNEIASTTSENLKYALQLINQSIPKLQNDPNDFFTNYYWNVSSITYYFDEEKPTLTAAGVAALDSLRVQNVYLSVNEYKTAATSYLNALNNPATTPSNLRYYAEDLSSYINKMASILSADAVKLFGDFNAQVANFKSSETIAAAAKLKKSIDAYKPGMDSSDIIYTAQSLESSLTGMTLSKTSAQLLKDLQLETSKASTQEIINAVAQLKTAMDASGDMISDEAFSAASDLSYYLSEKTLAVSPPTQAMINSFNALNSQIATVGELKGYVGSSLELKESDHFYFYSSIKKIYKLSKTLPSTVPAGTDPVAHFFLVQLCGEFRDRATMIKSKLDWIKNLQILPDTAPVAIDPTKELWSQVSAQSYYPYIALTGELWQARRAARERYIQVGKNQVDNPVPGVTVCETKYIFSEYVTKGKTFDDLATFEKNYNDSYKAKCPVADTEDYYDFRGDSNFKHYSPESNAMIWYATSLASACSNPTTVKDPSNTVYTSKDCEEYFKRPFYYRYNAARAGLATWLFRDEKHAPIFSSQGQMVAIYPHRQPYLAPFSFSFDLDSVTTDIFDFDPQWVAIQNAWSKSDIGFNTYTDLGGANPNLDIAYERIRDAVDRHTDWYNSGFNDKNGVVRNQAYSPFVASSYEMSASDSFTTCGITVPCPPDGLKRWMFVFRIKPAKWYTPDRILKNEKIDFDKMWFDETSFGVSGLADGEKAWDRLGSAMETDMDSILYLVNVNDGFSGGEFQGDGQMGDGAE